MTLLLATNRAADELEQLAGDLLALETEVSRGTADPEHLQAELAGARRRLRLVTEQLHDARRAR